MRKILLFAFVFISLFCQSKAGTYGPQNFEGFAAGTTDLGGGSALGTSVAGTAAVQARVDGAGQALRLTQDGVQNVNSSFKLPILDPNAEMLTFDVSFKVCQFSPDTLGDGFSLNFGNIPLGPDNGAGETGFAMANGLVIDFDTFSDSIGDAPRIKVFANGVRVGLVGVNFPVSDNTYHTVTVHYDSSGLDMTYDGTTLFANLTLPQFFPKANDRFAFSARTRLNDQETQIDDLSITTTSSAPVGTGGLTITEFLADNGDGIVDEDGDSSDWIELYNGTASAVNLSGWRLTNVAGNLGLWTFPSVSMPASSYLRVFASGKDRKTNTAVLHTNFTLEKSGGYLALVMSDGTTKTSEYNYGQQSEDVSFGTYGATQSPEFMIPTTPGTKNEILSVLHAAGPPAEEVVFSRDGGLITTAVSLTATAPTGVGAVIRYTENGTVPIETSPLFPAAGVTVAASKAIRARVFQPGRLPGDVSTRTFLLLDTSLTSYGNTGQPFNSNLPIVVVESWGVNVDATTNPGGSRPYQPIYSVVLGKDPANGNRAKLTGLVDFQGRGGMHVRGQTSSDFGQKPYAWEMWNNEDADKKSTLLGMPEESDWVLQTVYNDKTLMRNILPQTLIRELDGNGAGLRSQFVEVFFNQDGGPISYADYRGVYLLMERIKRGSDRIDISKITPLATDPALISGGYIYKHDKIPVAPLFTTTSVGGWGNQVQEIIEPEDATATQISAILGYAQQFDNALSGGGFADPATGYKAYIEPQTFMDNHIWVECFKQIDGYRLSTYYTKDRGQKIKAFPIWDYNLSGGNANYGGPTSVTLGSDPAGWYYLNCSAGEYPYYPRLFQDPDFKQKYWDRYWALRRSIFSTANVLAKIDFWANQLTDNNVAANVVNGASVGTGGGDFFPTTKANNLPPSQEGRAENPAMRHFDRWPILGVYVWPNAAGYNTRTTFQSEVQWMKDWFTNRLAWVDSQSMGSGLKPPNFSNSGGNVASGTPLTITNPNASGTIYYTTDGNDPYRGAGPAVTLIADTGVPCKYLVPSSGNGGFSLTAGSGAQQWTEVVDPPNIANWTSTTFGVGYDRNLSPVNYLPFLGANSNTESQMYGINATCYIRTTFNIPDQATLDNIGGLTLSMKYDDGFRAYVNGVLVAGRNDSHVSVTSTPWIAEANTTHDDNAALVFEDIPITSVGKPALRVGLNVLAIHALNAPSTSSDMIMIPRMTYTPSVTSGGTAQTYSGALPLNSSMTVTSRVLINGEWGPVTIGAYVVNAAPASSANVVVSEFCYDPAPSGIYTSKDLEFLVLRNIGAGNIDLTGVGLRGGADYTMTGTPQSLTLLPGGEAVIAANPTALIAVHGQPPAGVNVFGPFGGALGNSGDNIRIQTVSGAVIKDFTYQTTAPWPSGTTRSLVLLQPGSNPEHNDGNHWRASAASRGTPYTSDSVAFSGDWLADTDGDGYADGIEYALGTGSGDAASRPAMEATVGPEVVGMTVGNFLRLTFRRSLLNDAGALIPELTPDLVQWTSGSAALTRINQVYNGDGTVTETWRTTNPVTGDKAFVRLRAVAP